MRLLDTVTRAQLYTSAMSATQIAIGFVWLLPWTWDNMVTMVPQYHTS